MARLNAAVKGCRRTEVVNVEKFWHELWGGVKV